MNDFDQYPINLLPNIIANSVWEAYAIVKAPIPLLATSAISAISQACQSKIRVRRFNGMEAPCHIYELTIAASGERKTTADGQYSGPFEEFQRDQRLLWEPALQKFEHDLVVWKAEQKGLTLAIQGNIRKGLSVAHLKQQLAEHMASKSTSPTTPKIIYGDVTVEALLLGLQGWPSAGIRSDEAGALFAGRTFNQLAVFNSLWDGRTVTVDRKNAPAVSVSGAYLTISLMVQPATLQKFLGGKGQLARDNGFLARCLVCFPWSTQGSRFEHTLVAPQTIGLEAFRHRVREILDSTVDSAGRFSSDRQTLEFSWPAKQECLNFANDVEGQLAVNGSLYDVKDAASKISENMARVAALFHYFTGEVGDISLDTTQRAIAVCTWHLNQFKRIFGYQFQPTMEQAHCWALESWLRNYAARTNSYELPKNVILQYGPNPLRNKARLDASLFLLTQQQKIAVFLKNKTHWLQMLKPLFTPQGL